MKSEKILIGQTIMISMVEDNELYFT